MSWNKDAAVNYARNHAGSASQHRCAHFVSNAVRAGGARLINTNYAKDMAFNLRAAGFRGCLWRPNERRCCCNTILDRLAIRRDMLYIYGGDGTRYSDYKQTACTTAMVGICGTVLSIIPGTIDMKLLIFTSLLICTSAFATVSPTGPEAAALKFNHWYIAQLLKRKIL